MSLPWYETSPVSYTHLDVYKRQSLELAGSAERVYMRSYERQGLDIIPTVHMGAAVSALERKGIWNNAHEFIFFDRPDFSCSENKLLYSV